MILLHAIPRGRDAARTLSDLAEQTGLSRRQVEVAIQEARLAGHPIMSGSEGIWLATSADEVRGMYRRLRSRYVHQALTARAVLRSARQLEQNRQEELWAL